MKRNAMIGLMLMAALVIPGQAAAADPGSQGADSWQLSMLFTPSDRQLELERNGRVMIYDGVRSSAVNKALDENFERIGSMMFVNTVVTDDEGAPVHDPETGLLMVEDDGCD